MKKWQKFFSTGLMFYFVLKYICSQYKCRICVFNLSLSLVQMKYLKQRRPIFVTVTSHNIDSLLPI